MAGGPGAGSEDDEWTADDDEKLIQRLLSAAADRDVAADRRDRAAWARDAASRAAGVADPEPSSDHAGGLTASDEGGRGPAGSGPARHGPAGSGPSDEERGQNALDRAWAGRDRDAAAVDRAELIEISRRAATRAQARREVPDPPSDPPQAQPGTAPADAGMPVPPAIPTPGGRGRRGWRGRQRLVGSSADPAGAAEEDAGGEP